MSDSSCALGMSCEYWALWFLSIMLILIGFFYYTLNHEVSKFCYGFMLSQGCNKVMYGSPNLKCECLESLHGNEFELNKLWMDYYSYIYNLKS